jgi:hypothetical protein
MSHSRPARQPRAYRPRLEALEDRTLPSTFLVDHLADDMVGSGLTGSLRYCVTQANANPPNNTITFGVTGTINLTGALPTLTHYISIEGPGANLVTVHGDFEVAASSAADISGLTVDALENVGGIGSLGVSDCVVTDGVFSGGFNGAWASVTKCTVGEIGNGGQMTVDNSTITANDGGGLGPIYNGGPFGQLTLTNSTVSANNIYNAQYVIYNSGDLTILSCTISGNTVDNSYHTVYGLYNEDSFDVQGHAVIANTILAGNYGIDGVEVQEVFGGSHVHFQSPNLIGGYPALGDLRDNGGPTFTMATLAGSPALNHGSSEGTTTDQRGVARTGGNSIGAYQASASVLTLTGLPTSAVAGTPLSVTITAKDIFGKTAVGYTGTVHFGSTDGQAMVPGDYLFTLGDGGRHVFSNGVTLMTAGNQTVTATDTATASITGSASVSVNPAAADHLLFLQQPTDTPDGQTISPVVVEVVDQFGNVETDDNSDTITLALGSNPSGGTLSGTLTLTVVNGVATFSDLAIDLAGAGYTLHATSTGLIAADSGAFRIT